MKRQKGFGLLEILITLVVLGVGVVGLVGLSKSALTASQDGRRYEIAMRLAESKIDELRNFNSLVTPVPPVAQLKAYDAIATGSSTTPLSGDSYTVDWIVTPQFWNIATSVWQDTAPAGYLLNYPGRKQIATTVTWTNSEGKTSPFVRLVGYASPTQSLTSSQLSGGLDTARQGPKINYTPGVAPDVISIDLGNGSKQETNKPTPKVSAKNNTTGNEVQFDTVTYKPATDTSPNTQQIQQDISTVSCACSYGATASSYLPGQAYSTTTDQLYWKIGSLLSKQIGVVNGNGQPALCSSCCKDHFDGTGVGFKNYYAQLNTSRQRYNRTNTSSPLTVATSGSYLDACRFVRLDGVYSPIPDWNLVKVIVTTSDFLAKSANQASYQNYIQYVVKAYIDWQKQSLNWTSTPTVTPPTIADFNTWLATPSNVAQGGDSTTGITINTGTRQLIARGIYVDILDPVYLTGINTSVTGYLAKVPFQDINLTMLAEWSMPSLSSYAPLAPIPPVTPVSPPLVTLTGSVSDYATVTNEPIDTIIDLNNYYFGKYSRGYLHANKVTKDSKGNQQSVKVKATVYQGNSGVTASLISLEDQTNALSGELIVAIDGSVVSQPLLTVTGKVQCLEKTNKNNDPAPKACDKQTFGRVSTNTLTSGASCHIQLPQGNSDVAIYTCTAPQNSTLVVNFSADSSFLLNPSALNIPMMPPSDGSQVVNGPCTLLVENGVTNAANLTCSR